MSNVYVGVDCSLRKPGLTVLSATGLIFCGSLKTKLTGAARLDAAGGPLARGAPERSDAQVAGAVELRPLVVKAVPDLVADDWTVL